eukprot:CAMPEP_0113587402 /NCGR_PEP_ID=MMETSP0015_2-20120614/34879_1 /TAXON_ID=2838 /ORGANISM="Odontella" /LENGTH=75 /DNA_ID=CAMNT_0000493039 /DNA_START=50 /DNA_END=274 /DNA_ORIENTATION=- /assembly_acc=CAM_ASM_000160
MADAMASAPALKAISNRTDVLAGADRAAVRSVADARLRSDPAENDDSASNRTSRDEYAPTEYTLMMAFFRTPTPR